MPGFLRTFLSYERLPRRRIILTALCGLLNPNYVGVLSFNLFTLCDEPYGHRFHYAAISILSFFTLLFEYVNDSEACPKSKELLLHNAVTTYLCGALADYLTSPSTLFQDHTRGELKDVIDHLLLSSPNIIETYRTKPRIAFYRIHGIPHTIQQS